MPSALKRSRIWHRPSKRALSANREGRAALVEVMTKAEENVAANFGKKWSQSSYRLRR